MSYLRRSSSSWYQLASWTPLLGAACLAACTGGSSGAGGSADGSASGSGPGAPGGPGDPLSHGGTPASCPAGAPVSPGGAPMRRLTRFELNNTLRDLLGDDTSPANALPPEELGNGFGNDGTAQSTSRLLVEGYDKLAGAVVARVAADSTQIAALAGCQPTTQGEEACVGALLTSFGAKAFRRPLDEAETTPYLSLFKTLRGAGTYEDAIRGLLRALLQAPQLLYRLEFQAAAAPGVSYARLDPYETASRLSYLLWGSLPDAALFTAALNNQLQSKDQVRAQAERMLEDPRARAMVDFFHGVLFRLDGAERLQKNAADFPEFVGMAPLMKEETQRFMHDVLWEGDGTLTTLLSGSYSFMNAKLADFYGLPGPRPQGEAFERVELDPTRRAGLLTQGLMMTLLTPGAHTNPTLRGVFVMENLLCVRPPDPPAGINVVPPAYVPDLTTRERFAIHSQNPTCAGCHRQMDPFGFAFENFDPIGRWRDTDNGKPVDATGTILADVDVAGPFSGPTELAQRLSVSPQVRSCMIGHWFTFAQGRPETAADACTRAQLEAEFARSGFKIRSLLLALTQTDAFLYRAAGAP